MRRFWRFFSTLSPSTMQKYNRVQSNIFFLAITPLYFFVKSVHCPNVYWDISFNKVRNNDRLRKGHFRQKWPMSEINNWSYFSASLLLLALHKKVTHNYLIFNMLKVASNNRSLVTRHFSINFSRKKFLLIYNILIINILYTSTFFSDIEVIEKVTSDQVTFLMWIYLNLYAYLLKRFCHAIYALNSAKLQCLL